jgi:hypothetical protein
MRSLSTDLFLPSNIGQCSMFGDPSPSGLLYPQGVPYPAGKKAYHDEYHPKAKEGQVPPSLLPYFFMRPSDASSE